MPLKYFEIIWVAEIILFQFQTWLHEIISVFYFTCNHGIILVCVCVFVCFSVHQVFGPRLFTTSGHAYQHLFNISLCGGDDRHDIAVCTDNMTSRNDTTDNNDEQVS